jgi:glycosyltransferase involved in cell wall biosynthesis
MESPHHGNQVNPPQSPNKPDRLVAAAYSNRRVNETLSKDAVSSRPAEVQQERKSLALLLDLSSDKSAAIEWASGSVPGLEIRQINKVDLKWKSKREALSRVRSLGPEVFCVFTSDLTTQPGLSALMLFAIMAGARRIVIGDCHGRAVSRTRLGVLLLEAPRFALEVVVGYGLLVPLSWLLTEVLGILLALRAPVRASRVTRRQVDPDVGPSLCALYVRATLATAAEGGMPTHIAGLTGGAARLGHRLVFLVSGPEISAVDRIVIAPSRILSATKALFELWHNLFFTVKSLRLITSDALSPNQFDFIYQRYSRFNWTGVVLSVLTGLPLVLEFNGSEVWVSRQWDPIGQLWLLRRFERLNQRAVDLIFVVSDVERRNLVNANVRPEKVIVNPNGADTDDFRPGSGGREVRCRLGIEDKTVIGFIGTFGPWHGAPVLAEAARMLMPDAGCHFLFIGDGEQRAQTESIIEAAGVSATFTGRVSHREVPAHLDACDILVSPQVPSTDGSEFFGSPTKLFEYMSMAKPIVASRLGQIAEVIADDESGLLVEPGDANALARAIERLAQDHALRARLGAAARQTVIERYTWKHNAARVFEAVRSTLR